MIGVHKPVMVRSGGEVELYTRDPPMTRAIVYDVTCREAWTIILAVVHSNDRRQMNVMIDLFWW